MQQHKHMLNEQDDHLNEIQESVNKIYNVTLQMNIVIDEQGKKIVQLDREIDKTQKKMNFVQKRLVNLLKTNDQSQISIILILFGILFLLLFFLIYL